MRYARLVAVAIVGVLAVAWALLAVTDSSLLIYERRVKDGETMTLEDFGTVRSGSLACLYFTGRGSTWIVIQYAPSGTEGRRSCPVVGGDS